MNKMFLAARDKLDDMQTWLKRWDRLNNITSSTGCLSDDRRWSEFYHSMKCSFIREFENEFKVILS